MAVYFFDEIQKEEDLKAKEIAKKREELKKKRTRNNQSEDGDDDVKDEYHDAAIANIKQKFAKGMSEEHLLK